MNIRAIILLAGVLAVAGLLAGPPLKRSFTQGTPSTGPARSDKPKCPVCGMFVDQHAAWLGKIRFRDGQAVYFDGVKDLFKYYFDIGHYDSGRNIDDIQSLEVTDYYSLNTIDGYRSRYVIGSDILGPMGHELIPFGTEQAAREFLQDHHGEQILTFDEVRREMISSLEREDSNELRRQPGGARGEEL